jgi:hypothetical protein
MKLIVSGSTGLVGTEVLRQSLLNPKLTSVIALTRRPIDVSTLAAGLKTDGEINVNKVKSVVVQDFTKYPEDVKKELADADACIWYVTCYMRNSSIVGDARVTNLISKGFGIDAGEI